MTNSQAARRSDPLVSFLIVSYNAGAFLGESVASAFGQTYGNVEIVLVDNASTDGSVERLAEVWAGQPALRVIRANSNLGPSRGAMLGLPHCRGEFIARMDADDVALPDRIACQVDYLQSHPDKDAVGADVIRINAAGTAWAVALSLRSEFLRRHASKWVIGCLHTTLFVRRTAATERGYNPTLFTSEDFEWIEWMAREGRLGLVPKVLCLYRQHSFSITRRLGHLQRLTDGELKIRLSLAANDPGKRRVVFETEFGFLMSDPRLAQCGRSNAHEFEAEARRNGDLLAAAYFASIGGRWTRVPGMLLRALASGRSWKDVAALGLCRTAWPLWQRLHNVCFHGIRHLSPSVFESNGGLPTSLRLARRFNAFRNTLRTA